MNGSYKVCWNNICLLSRLEESITTSQNNPNFSYEYFGMGREKDLLDCVKNSGYEWSILLSSDTDIFQDQRVLLKRKKELYSWEQESIESKINNNALYDHPNYWPFIVIPLVMIVNTQIISQIPKSLEELTTNAYKREFTFGGMHNSAGRSLLKAVWTLYGKEAVVKFLNNASIQSMPAAAFKNVIDKKVPIGIVPTIFAAREGLDGLKMVIPKEGAVAIPSYIAAKKNVPDSIIQEFMNDIYWNKEFHELLWKKGKVSSPLIKESQIPVYYPSQRKLLAIKDEEFYSLIKPWS